MIIKLNEIPDEGKDFDFDQTTGELNLDLNDVLKGNPHSVHLRIQPMGSAIEARGRVTAQLPVECAFCAKSFNHPVQEPFHDLLMSKSKTKCDIKGNESDFEDSNVTVTELEGNNYEFGAYIRELLLLAEPFQPECKKGCLGLCSSCGADKNDGPCSCSEEKTARTSAFSVLKSLKLD